MAKLTLVIDDEVLRRARLKAVEQGTSVNAIVRGQIADYVAGTGPDNALRAFRDGAARSRASSGVGGRSWTRDDLYGR